MVSGADSLQMDHLTSESLKREVDDLTGANSPDANGDWEKDPRAKNLWTFRFLWTDSRGKTWEGNFINRIMTTGRRASAGAMQARLSGGLPWESLDEDTQFINKAIAHMSYSLDSEHRPDWAKDLLALEDLSLLAELWRKVVSHETYYFRRTATVGEGEI